MGSMRQTKTFLIARLQEMGIRPVTKYGQNFLIDLNLQQLIVDAGELCRDDVVLEVGTGTGSLTVLLAERAAHVITVEVDRYLYELASEQLLEFDNVTMLQLDALKNKNQFKPELLAAIHERVGAADGLNLKLVANLPYNIATPVLSNLLFLPTPPTLMAATIQKELADRITAKPGTKDYGALSVWMQSQCDVETLRTLPPSVFWPVPKVTSAIVRIRLNPQRRACIPDLRYFHQFTRAVFLHRRKFLRANLLAAMKRYLDKPQVDDVMAELQLATDARTEQLAVSTLLELTEAVRRLAPDWSL